MLPEERFCTTKTQSGHKPSLRYAGAATPQQRRPMSGCRVLMKLTASHKPLGDVGRLQLGAFRRRMGSEIAGDSDEDVPTLVGIAPLAELLHAGIEYLVGMET